MFIFTGSVSNIYSSAWSVNHKQEAGKCRRDAELHGAMAGSGPRERTRRGIQALHILDPTTRYL